MNDWHNIKAEDFIDFNPREHLPQGTTAKKVSMEKLQPFSRSIASYDIASFSGGTKFRNGDTIMARITPCLENGKTAQVNCLEDNEVGFGSTEFIVMRAKPSISDSDFIYYLATSPFFRNIAIQSMVGSSGRQRVQQSVLNATELFVPPLSEQIEIGRTLRSLDDKIENNTKINHHLEQMAQAIFKSWFDCYDPSQPFTNAVQVLGGGTPKTGNESYWNGEIPFFTPKDTGSLYVLSTEKRLSEAGLSNCNSRLYPVNTVFVTARGTVGKLALAGCPMAMNQSCYALVSNGDYGQFYMYHLALTVVEKLKRKANGAVFDAIVTRDFENELVPAPATKEIKAFEDKIQPIFETILNNCKENVRLAELRDTLLPRLMSGELSVADLGDGK